MNYRFMVMDYANDFLREKNLNVSLSEMEEEHGLARYNPDKSYIELNAGLLIKFSNHLGIPLKDYTIITLCHELGHYFDENNLRDVDKISEIYDQITQDGLELSVLNLLLDIRYGLEERAIQIGSGYVPSRILVLYNRLNGEYLDTVKERELQSVTKLQNLIKRKNFLENS